MAAVAATSSVTDTTQQAAAAAGASSRNNLGKMDFLKLLVAQLQHQDPMNPMDNQQFIAQLAQFNSLEQMINLNQTLQQQGQFQQLAYAASLIGHQVIGIAADSGTTITGAVDKVAIVSGEAMLDVNGQSLKLSEVTGVSQ